MNGQLVRTRVGEGIHLNRIADPKFKHNRLSVNFVLPLDEKKASVNAVVPYILRMGPAVLPDFSSLNARLQELYGATLEAGVSKFGGYQVLEISLRALDNRYALEGEDLTAACAELLAQTWLAPKLDVDGMLDEKNTRLQKQYIKDTIEAEINEKRTYSLAQCIRVMCEGEPVAVRTYGTPDTADAITAASATAAYREMLGTAPVEIIFTGAGDGEKAGKILSDAFLGLSRDTFSYSPVKLRPTADKIREKTERMEISQSKLVLGMRCGAPETPREIAAARLFSALYGGAPFSKLFLNVREKLSLCYYCASRFDSSTKLLMVDSGVEAGNKEKAQEEILAQLKAMADGDISDEELRQTKLIMRNSVQTVGDSAAALEGWYMAQILRGRIVSPGEDIALLEQITKEELIEAARKVTLDTVYFLTGEEDAQ